MKKRVIQEDKRYRLFFLELYHDTTSYDYDEVKRILKGFKNWAYITHDKDLNENGEIKKVHDHWIVKLDNAMTGKAFKKKTTIPLQFCQEIINERSCCRYLIHSDDDDKYQYNIDEVKTSTNYNRHFKKCFDEVESEEQIICNIRTFIENLKGVADNQATATFMLIQYVNSNCYDTIYKRYRYEFSNLLSFYY